MPKKAEIKLIQSKKSFERDMMETECNRYSDIGEQVDRTDKKKSQVFLAGIFNTAPSYYGYSDFKHALATNLERGDN